ncbi:MAG: cytochrome c biogenesis protein CcsA [Elusimicrobiota bacterium]|nr:cytochrome c biogenesis protein CcsA [Elusimicrobiota bacterium]
MKPRSVAPAVFVLGLLAALLPLRPAPAGDYDADAFGRLPVLEGGRVKPLDSFGRNALLMMRSKQSVPVDGRRFTASRWLLDALFKPEAADTYKTFVVDDPEVLGLLGLEPGKERYFAYWQLEPKRAELRAQAAQAEKLEAPRRSRFQTAAVNLDRRLTLYERLKNTVQIAGTDDAAVELALLGSVVPAALRAVHGGGTSERDRRAVRVLAELLSRFRFLADAAVFKAVPPRAGEPVDAWRSNGEALLKPQRTDLHPAVTAFALMGRSYRKADPAGFDAALREYQAWLEKERPAFARSAEAEVLFNRAAPFVTGMALYVIGLLLIFASWARPRAAGLPAAASGLLWAAFVVHTAGLFARVVLQGRPPVTNLYSSAVFVGWVAAFAGLLAERLHRRGFAAAGAAAVGFCTLLVAHHLTGSGDTMEMMRAVLDSNFWLATHVITITIGYGGTFLAGLLGLVWVARRHFAPRRDPADEKALSSLAYGVVCFSLLFSFIGTMLGGIWADQSWGRFWGWDPKENGALLIVLWNALILHARWAGLARERGVMVLVVLGNVVTAWSWFGVNMLGVGLHSYGFMDKAFWWLSGFAASQLLAAALGLLPPRFWTERRNA